MDRASARRRSTGRADPSASSGGGSHGAGFERLYVRAGPRYLDALLGMSVVLVLLLMVPGYCAMLGPYFDITMDEYVRYVAAYELAFIVWSAGHFAIFRRRHAALVKWIRGERTPEAAPAAWESAVVDLPGTIRLDWVWGLASCVAPAAYVATVAQLSSTGWMLYMLVLALVLAGVAVFAYLGLEQAWRPVVREIAGFLPERFAPQHQPPSLGAKLLAMLIAINVFTGMVVAVLSTNALGLTGRLAVTLGATVAVSATLALTLTLMVRHSLLVRLADLQDGLARVDRGDYDTRMLAVAGDELDELGAMFNTMVAGLRERASLHSAMGSYVDPVIAERIMAEGSSLTGEAVDVTVMFLDIVGFTERAEGARPEDVVSDLNEVFGVVIPLVEHHGGHANKLLGDGLMAVFGIPVYYDDHADRAVRAAREIQGSLLERYEAALRVGIGLNSGTVVSGSMGGGGKLDFTIIGDVVNVAARVEALTRITGDAVLITEETRLLLPPDQVYSDRGSHRIRGRQAEVSLHAVEV